MSNKDSKEVTEILDPIWSFCEGLLRSNYPKNSLKGFITAVDKNPDSKNNRIRMFVKVLKGTKVELDQMLHASINERLTNKSEDYQRLIKDVYYYTNLRENAHSLNHFSYQINPDYNLTFDKDGFSWPKAHYKFNSYVTEFNKNKSCRRITNDQKILWRYGGEDLLSFILNKKHPRISYFNEFDIFFLPSKTERLIFLPIPILSCVSLFIVLAEDKNAVIDWSVIYKESRYIVINSIFVKLRERFLKLEKSRKLHKLTEIDFCKQYVRELAYAFLPRAYYLHDARDKGPLPSNDQLLLKELKSLFISYCSKKKGVCKVCIVSDSLENSTYSLNNQNIEFVLLDYSPCPYKVVEKLLDGSNHTKDKDFFNYDIDDFVSKTDLENKFIVEIELDKHIDETRKEILFQVWFFIPTFVVPHQKPLYPHEDDIVLIQNYPGYHGIVKEFKTQVRQNWKNLYTRWQSLRIINRYATKAAISQAMLRNISHNHGSHVLVNLVDVEKISQKQIDKLVNKEGSYNYTCGLENFEKELSGQTAIFNKFIKQRMDFLSEITFGVSNMVTSINLSEVYRELDKNLILLNHISGIDNLKFSIVFKHSGNISLDQLLVAFPSDILGCQSLYNIIEAVIRNTAKYGIGTGTDKSETVFTLEFSDLTTGDDKENQFYQVEIYDNRNIIDGKTFEKIQNIVKKPVIDENTNELRSEGLGLLEMQACAAFLRQIDVSEIDNEQYYPIEMKKGLNKSNELPILEPFLKDRDYLGYRFYVQKPKEFLFVGDWKTNDDSQTIILERFGINYLSTYDFVMALEKGKTFYHQFLLFDDTINEMSLKLLSQTSQNSNIEEKSIPLSEILMANREIEGVPTLLTLLPVRMMDVTNVKEDLKKIMFPPDNKKFDFNELEDKVWMLWKDHLFERLKLNDRNVIKFISERSDNDQQDTDQNEYTICILDHDRSYENCKKSEGIKIIEPLSSNAQKKLPGWQTGFKINDYIRAIQTENEKELVYEKCLEILKQNVVFINKNTIKTYDDIIEFLQKGKLYYLIDKCDELASSFRRNSPHVTTKYGVKLFESYVNSVIIIEERIQEYAEGKYKGIENYEIFENIACYIPRKRNKKVNPGPNAEECIVNLADKELSKDHGNKIFDFIERHIDHAHFLIIHYGLLERLYNNIKVDVSESNKEKKIDRSESIRIKLSEWAKKIKVVVTSGRGKHSLDLPDDVCYVNLSPVTNAFVENRSKYAINYLLNQTRR